MARKKDRIIKAEALLLLAFSLAGCDNSSSPSSSLGKQSSSAGTDSSFSSSSTTVSSSSSSASAYGPSGFMYEKKEGDHLQVFALEMTGTFGDSTLFKYGDWEMLIDAGNPSSSGQVRDFLKEYVTDRELDVLLITHPHSDHFGGLVGSGNHAEEGGVLTDAGIDKVDYLVDSGMTNGSQYDDCWIHGVREYWIAHGAQYCTAAQAVKDRLYDAVWKVTPDVSVQWLNTGTYGKKQGNLNNNSVCLNLRAGTYDFPMVGDAQDIEVDGIMNTYSRLLHPFIESGDTVVFKACHHGSGTADSGNTSAFMNYLKPSYGWASSGIIANNGAQEASTPSTQQHPYRNAVEAIVAKTGDENFYWNGTNGTIDMSLSEDFEGFAIGGEGRKYGYGYNIGGVLVSPESEKSVPLLDTKWATTGAFIDGGGGSL
ncbi:MAG: MBL fold metallo-hydrolase [Bacilli bacterium]|jgi:beta-lactamase superfamily II metal-dependent hydrolase|nr:MBL fold metallo-hydrolase [Bacilli bacterium]